MIPLSIITVTYNAGKEIVTTLDSVEKQSYTDFEHIFVDGGSKDDTVESIRQAKINNKRILVEKDNGIYDAMNKGLRMAQGEFVLFLNAGDSFADTDVILKFMNALKENPKANVFYGQTSIVDSHGNYMGPRHLTAPDVLTAQDFKKGMLVCHQAFFARRSCTEPYNLRYSYSADFDWCLRILLKGSDSIYLGDNPIVKYLNEGTTTKNHFASLKERFDIMKAYFGFIPTIINHIGFVTRAIKRCLK